MFRISSRTTAQTRPWFARRQAVTCSVPPATATSSRSSGQAAAQATNPCCTAMHLAVRQMERLVLIRPVLSSSIKNHCWGYVHHELHELMRDEWRVGRKPTLLPNPGYGPDDHSNCNHGGKEQSEKDHHFCTAKTFQVKYYLIVPRDKLSSFFLSSQICVTSLIFLNLDIL